MLKINVSYNIFSNKLQDDLDGDGAGDVCDEDIDNDGLINQIDNCPKVHR